MKKRKGNKMPIINQESLKIWEKKNTDPYGKCCIDVAKEVMKILDKNESFDVHKIICDADKNAEAGGITGFMASFVTRIVVECHSRGDEFRKAWNKEVGTITGQEESEGILNPALLRIHVKEKEVK
jgi:hypothetical protein